MHKRKHIKALPVIDHSGFMPKHGCIPFAKKHHYFIVTGISITGDAPKDFIRYYQYGEGFKINPKTWPLYLAKHGHKHYPMEAITEYLLNRIGEVFGFNMAKSGLAWFGGQIRFLSKYFLFDALIGNNDRHFYNWGIIRDVQGKKKPVFSPIYDTARGLFWNDHDDKLKEIYNDKTRLDSFIRKYSDTSSPKIGWDGYKRLNHFELAEKLTTSSFVYNCETLINSCYESKISEVIRMIDKEFSQLLSNERRELIKSCLLYRHSCIRKIFNFAPCLKN